MFIKFLFSSAVFVNVRKTIYDCSDITKPVGLMQKRYWKRLSFILNFLSNILPSHKYWLNHVRCVCRKERKSSRKVAVECLILSRNSIVYHFIKTISNVTKICGAGLQTFGHTDGWRMKEQVGGFNNPSEESWTFPEIVIPNPSLQYNF